ncbi:MAG: hypothetical protein IJO19_02760, partial [Clostridia bacterium]|nr:hypothetical protein [Clostridia bacterium]
YYENHYKKLENETDYKEYVEKGKKIKNSTLARAAKGKKNWEETHNDNGEDAYQNAELYDGTEEGELYGKYRFLTDEEKDTYYYLLAKKGEKEAQRYLDDVNDKIKPGRQKELNEKNQSELVEYWKNASALEKGIASVVSIPENVIGGMVGAVDYVGSKALGKELNPYSNAQQFANEASAIREGTAESINSKIGKNVYNFAMSMGDFAAELLLTKGIGKAAGLGAKGTSRVMQGIVSTNAFNSTVTQAKEKGIDDNIALLQGFASGIIEAVTEKYSIDSLLKIKPGDKVYKQILKNFAIEGSEEVASNIANFIVDNSLNCEKSDFRLAVERYKELGFSETEAMKKAYIEQGKSMLQDFIAGGAMGAIAGGGTAISTNINNKNWLSNENVQQYSKNLLNSNLDINVIENAKKLSINTSAAENAIAQLESVAKIAEQTPSENNQKAYMTAFEKASNEIAKISLYVEQSGYDPVSGKQTETQEQDKSLTPISKIQDFVKGKLGVNGNTNANTNTENAKSGNKTT